ncbi:ATP-binding protein [Streptomyces sp. BBFR109]|uniref:ATP-binding protein n=1 Tax=Streptomyces sp. BBFR109 TaxID=3448172 RepID=UPI003F760F23
MAEPATITQRMPSELGALMRAVAEHCPNVTPGPIDETPRPEDPGHPEYHRRQRAEFALARWRTATPRRYQQAVADHPAVIAWADAASTDLDQAGDLLLTGPTGTGKTYQAYGALRRIAEAGPRRYEAIATTAPDLYGRLRPGGSDRGTEDELRRLCRVPLLLIDDLGAAKHSEWVEEVSYRIFNERYNACRPTVITTNLPPRNPHGTDLADRLGDRLVSRFAESTTIVPVIGPDRRRQPRSAA